MGNPPPAVQQLGTAVLLQGAALLDARRFVTLGIRAASRDGIAAPPRVALLLRALTDASACPLTDPGREDGPAMPTGAASDATDTITTAEVATLLGLSTRQTRRLARTLEARQLRSGVYVYDRTAVDAYLIDHNHHSRKATPA